MKQYPENADDLRLMLDTSCGWFDGQFRYERLCEGEPDIGDEVSRSKHISVDCDGLIYIYDQIDTCFEVDGTSKRYDVRRENEECMNFATFRSSGYWAECMEKFKDGDCDSSVFDVSVGEEDGWSYIKAGLLRTYTDWLFNRRVAKGHDDFSISYSGFDVMVSLNGEQQFIDARELLDAVKQYHALRDAGVRIDEDGTLSVKLAKPGDEDSK